MTTKSQPYPTTFKGLKGPGHRVVLPQHKANSGKTRAKQHKWSKVDVSVCLNWERKPE